MKICCIGGAGFIGSALVPALLDKHDVTVVDLFWFGDNLPSETKKIEMDARKLEPHDFLGFDAVIFLAGLSNDPMADFDPWLNFELNAALPAYLAHAARKAGVKKFIHGGSCSVYGHSKIMMHEDSFPCTTSAYGVSKLLGEKGCLQYQYEGMKVVAFRMGTVCGISNRMRFDLVINAMAKDAVTKGTITVHDPKAHRPILDIRDAVAAYRYAVESNYMNGVINLISENIDVAGIAQKVAFETKRLLGKSVFVDVRDVADVRSYTASDARLRRTGFVVHHTVDNTVQHVLEDYFWDGFVDENRFHNIRVFKALKGRVQHPAGALSPAGLYTDASSARSTVGTDHAREP